jgi:hypothetical protein
MAKPQRDGKSLNVVHEHKAVKGREATPVVLRVRYERRNMEAFLSSVGISQERLEVYEQDALYDALEWGEDHPGEEEAKAGDVLMDSFCELLKEAEHPMEEPLTYGLRIRRRGKTGGDDEALTYYSISL